MRAFVMDNPVEMKNGKNRVGVAVGFIDPRTGQKDVDLMTSSDKWKEGYEAIKKMKPEQEIQVQVRYAVVDGVEHRNVELCLNKVSLERLGELLAS